MIWGRLTIFEEKKMACEPEGSGHPQQTHQHGPVIGELLCFVTNKLSVLPPETIVFV